MCRQIHRILHPLSVAQSGIWLAQAMFPNSPLYNIGEYLEIQGLSMKGYSVKPCNEQSRKQMPCGFGLSRLSPVPASIF
jgi:hypothetical protein